MGGDPGQEITGRQLQYLLEDNSMKSLPMIALLVVCTTGRAIIGRLFMLLSSSKYWG